MHGAVLLTILGLLASLLAEPAGAEEGLLPGAGTAERREQCEGFVEYLSPVHAELSSGVSKEQLAKQVAIEFAGNDNASELANVLIIQIQIADYYVAEGKSSGELVTDFLYECVTKPVSLDEAVLALVMSEFPAEHPLRRELDSPTQSAGSNIKVRADAALEAQSYRELLGDDFNGTQSIRSYERRTDGVMSACGLEYSHTLYDYQHRSGQPVKLSSSINLLEHPDSGLYGMVKLKAELLTIFVSGEEPDFRFRTLSLGNIHTLADGMPISDGTQDISCEDAEYRCHLVLSSWAELIGAAMDDLLGLAYRPAGGTGDVIIRLSLSEPEEHHKERYNFATCLEELMNKVAKQIEGM